MSFLPHPSLSLCYTHQGDHLGDVVSVRPVDAVFVLPEEERQLLGEDVEDGVDGREGVLCDKYKQHAFDILYPRLVQLHTRVTHANQKCHQL